MIGARDATENVCEACDEPGSRRLQSFQRPLDLREAVDFGRCVPASLKAEPSKYRHINEDTANRTRATPYIPPALDGGTIPFIRM